VLQVFELQPALFAPRTDFESDPFPSSFAAENLSAPSRLGSKPPSDPPS